jgi:CBS domain-containing protein
LLGIVTESDCLKKVILQDYALRNVSLRQIMTPHPTTVSRQSTVFECMIKMAVGKFSHLPVVQPSSSSSTRRIHGENNTRETQIREFAHKESGLKPERRQHALDQQQEIHKQEKRHSQSPEEVQTRYLDEARVQAEGGVVENSARSIQEGVATEPAAEQRAIGVVSIGDIIHTMLEENTTAMRYMQEYVAGDYSATASHPRHQSHRSVLSPPSFEEGIPRTFGETQ